MATPNDVVDKLHRLNQATATRIARAPTGVRPGYHPELGGTVDEAGRLLYVGGGGSKARIWMAAQNLDEGQIIPAGARVPINFNLVTLDPPDVPGAPSNFTVGDTAEEWAFTGHDPAGSVALIGIHVVVHANGSGWEAENVLTLEWGPVGVIPSAVLQRIDQYRFTGTAGDDMEVTLHGIGTTLLYDGDASYCAYLTNGAAVDRIIGGAGYIENRFWLLKLAGSVAL